MNIVKAKRGQMAERERKEAHATIIGGLVMVAIVLMPYVIFCLIMQTLPWGRYDRAKKIAGAATLKLNQTIWATQEVSVCNASVRRMGHTKKMRRNHDTH